LLFLVFAQLDIITKNGEKIRRKKNLMEEILVEKVRQVDMEELKLSPSAQEIFLILKNGPFTPKEILLKTSLSPRTLRYALKKLLGLNLVRKFPNFEDLRQNYYVLAH